VARKLKRKKPIDITAAIKRMAEFMQQHPMLPPKDGPYDVRIEYSEIAEGELAFIYDKNGRQRGFMNPDQWKRMQENADA